MHSVGQELYHCLLSMASTSVLLQPNETQCYHNLPCKAYHQLSIIHSIGMRRGNNKVGTAKEFDKVKYI